MSQSEPHTSLSVDTSERSMLPLHQVPAHDRAARDVEVHVAPPARDRRRRVVQAVAEVRADDRSSGKATLMPSRKIGCMRPAPYHESASDSGL